MLVFDIFSGAAKYSPQADFQKCEPSLRAGFLIRLGRIKLTPANDSERGQIVSIFTGSKLCGYQRPIPVLLDQDFQG